MRQEWIVESGGMSFLVVRGLDAALVVDPSRLTGAEAAARLPRLVLSAARADPRAGWMRAASMVLLGGAASASRERHDDAWMLRELERAFGDGRLVALAFGRSANVRLDPASLAPEPESAASEPAPAPPIEADLTWIEIELLDVRGVPVPHEPFELVLADGEVRTGSTDAAGLALVDEIPAGACKVTFPGLDGREWSRA